MNRNAAAIEAILFSMGEPVDRSRLSEALSLSEEEIKEAARELSAKLDEEDHGIKLIALEDSYQLVTKPEHYESLIAIASNPKKPTLTDTLMETLSIIAYRQPVTKSEIEKIRGVSSDHAVNRLVEYDLVRELGRLPAPGRPMLFGTTDEFLRRFGLETKDELPEMDPVAEADFRSEAESEVPVSV